MDGDNDSDVMTVAEAARLLRLPKSSIYRMTARHTIPHKRLGRKRGRVIRFSRSRLLAWWAARPEEPMQEEEPVAAPETPALPEESSRDAIADAQRVPNATGRRETRPYAKNGRGDPSLLTSG